MKVVVLYRPNSEFSRSVESFVDDLRLQHGIDERHLEILDYDSRDGYAMASLYDIIEHPAILVIGNNGSYIKHWQGPVLPRVEEVASYSFSFQ